MARDNPVNAGYYIINGSTTGKNASAVNTWIEYQIIQRDINLVKIHVLLYSASTNPNHNTSWSEAKNFGYVECNSNKQKYLTTYSYANCANVKFADYIFEIPCTADSFSVSLSGAFSTNTATGVGVDGPFTPSVWISGGAVSGTVNIDAVPQYTVYYNADGGSPTPDSQTEFQGIGLTLASAPSKYYDVITTFDANGGSVNPTTVKSTAYYPFSGWKASNGTIYGAGDIYTANEPTTMTAQWGAATGGSSISFPTPTRNGYTFVGWYYNGSPYTNHSPTTSKTLTAQWKPNQYTITYDANGGTGYMEPDIVIYMSDFITKPNLFEREGYIFNGWIDSLGNEWTLNSNGVYESGKGPWAWEYTENITLYAQWKPKNYSLTVQGYIDGNLENGILGYGLFDVYVDGKEYQLDCDNEFTASLPYGSSYEIKNIRAEKTTVYNGVLAGNLSGTIDEDKIIILQFSTKAITTDLNIKVKANGQAKQGVKGVIRKDNQNKKIIRFYTKVNGIWKSK